MVCSNTTGKNLKSVVLKTQGSDSLKDNIITVLGMNTFSCLEPVAISISDDCKVEGFLSKPGHGSGRNLGDRQYFFVNGRPVDMPKVSKLVNELYKGANSRQYPIAIMNFTVPARACDVNVTPDKRKIFFSDECSILHVLREGLQQIYSANNVSYSVNEVDKLSTETDSSEFYSASEKSNMLPNQILPEGLNEVHLERDITDLKTSSETNEIGAQQLHGIENTSASDDIGVTNCSDEKSTVKKFTLRAHDNKKVDDLSKFTCGKSVTSVGIQKISASYSGANKNSGTENRDANRRSSCVQSSISKFITVNKRKFEHIDKVLSEMPLLRNQSSDCELKKKDDEMHPVVTRSPVRHLVDDSAEMNNSEPLKIVRSERFFKERKNPSLSDGITDVPEQVR